MRKSIILILVLMSMPPVNTQNDLTPPDVEKRPKELTIHNDTRIDNYYWLNDRENKDVIKYLNDENRYTKQMLEHTEGFQDNLFNEMVGRIKQTDLSVPYQVRGYWYYTRYEEGKEYPIYCRKKGNMDADEEIMLNVNEMAEGANYYSVVGVTVSPDNNLIAYGVDNVSRRKYTMYVKDLTTGKIFEESVKNTDGSYVWANDNKTLFYDVKDDETLRTYLIKKHVLGTDPKEDQDVFEEKDETFGVWAYKSKSEDYIFIHCYSTQTTETFFLDANNPNGEFKTINGRERDHKYSVGHFQDHFYITSNKGALNYRMVKVPVDNLGEDHWEEIIPHRKEVLLDGFDIFKDFLVVSERENGLTQIRIMSWDGKTDYRMEFPEPVYTAGTSTNPEFDTEVLRYSYTSLVTPNSVFDFDMNTKKSTLLKQQEVIGGHDPNQYISKRLYATASDGTKIPMSIVYHKDTKPGKDTPLLQYAYGSYGYSMDAYFSSVRLSLLDRGFIYVIAHIRGGEEMGRQWYEDGKKLKKKNTFTDFIACSEHLIKEEFTSADHLYAMGGSAGGLLMGAVVNMRPELYNGVIAGVPFVDVVTTMLDESIPLTTGEFDEWGNPKDKEYYDYIKSYSPYDNVVAQEYPNMLVTTGLHDSQVQYWEPAKWVAKLRDLKTDLNKLLLFCEMEAGHGGKSGRFERLKEVALEYAFLLDLEGINK